MHDTHYVVTRVDTSTSPIRYTLRTGRRKLILTMKLIKGNENVIYHERPSSEPSEIEERISSLIDPIYSCSYYRDNIVTITSNDRRSWG